MKTIGVRDFLRGGYKDITEPVMVMSNNRPLGVWRPTEEVDEVSKSVSYSIHGSSYPVSWGTATADWGSSLSSTTTYSRDEK